MRSFTAFFVGIGWLIKWIFIGLWKLITLPYHIIMFFVNKRKEKIQKANAALAKEQQRQAEERRKQAEENERIRKLRHYETSSTVTKIVDYLKQKGLPYKIVVNYENIVAYYQGGTASFDFLTNGLANFDAVTQSSFDKTDKIKNSDIYLFSQALNQRFDSKFKVCEVSKFYQTNTRSDDYEVYGYTSLTCVELRRELNKI